MSITAIPSSPPPQRMSYYDALERLRENARNTTEKGLGFEDLVKFFLKNDPLYADKFKSLYKPKDVGVDIIAVEASEDEDKVWAIQAKFYDKAKISRKDIDTFMTESGKKGVSRRLIVSTTDDWGKNARDALIDQTIPCTIIGPDTLERSQISWEDFFARKDKAKVFKHKMLPHQKKACADVMQGLSESSRGKLIMACGTGKTFTALNIAEQVAGKGGKVLFLVPSLSLMSQTIQEWMRNSTVRIYPIAVCSDKKVGRERRRGSNETEDRSMIELPEPATTDSKLLADRLAVERPGHMTVVFATYHSLDVVVQAQKGGGGVELDLAICDEAHRTTGVDQADVSAKRSYYTAIHEKQYLRARKRLYMTATPRLYAPSTKLKAKEAEAELYSMDDEAIYGAELHRLGFYDAVQKGLLSDYKVLVLAIRQEDFPAHMQKAFSDEEKKIQIGDKIKMIGCWNALAKKVVRDPEDENMMIKGPPMQRAVMFTQTIEKSELLMDNFKKMVDEYLGEHTTKGPKGDLICQIDHVDGTMNAVKRSLKLRWLKQGQDGNEDGNPVCRILSNARCLTEGVDVPALDAVIFMHERKSQVDVVQAVGRVMRKTPDKDFGYVILPVVIPSGMSAEEGLDANQQYRVVWQVLQALRSHDERFEALINRIELNKGDPEELIVGVPPRHPGDSGGGGEEESNGGGQLSLPFIEWREALFARIVLKCGSKRYWEQWAADVGKIAKTTIGRIAAVLKDEKAKKEFVVFLKMLQKNLNPGVSEEDAVEMLAQHLITKPVFEALFDNYDFAGRNPVSQSMQKMVRILVDSGLEAETGKLEKFYASVRERASGIDNAEGKQKVVLELYDKFFRTAFKKDAERLGIVYTPVEVVDFILNSTDAILKKELNCALTDRNVHVLDPFTGTGTFLTRLLQSSDLIRDKDLIRKYADELHANEIVLLAYYIAAINIEETFHFRSKQDYQQFNGIVLTDTFQMNENVKSLTERDKNSERAKKQSERQITVILGNPPYSAGQRNANDNNPNVLYPTLDGIIRDTYAAKSSATNKNAIYDSYIRAIRWATDRIGNEGIIGFITNGSFIDGNVTSGLRKCLMEDFSSIYVLNMRGNARTSGERRRQEKDNVFGQGTRTTVALTFLVKNPHQKTDRGNLYYCDIGDYLSRKQKLDSLRDKTYADLQWTKITPNEQGDWINKRDPKFATYLPMGRPENKKKKSAPIPSIFTQYSSGVKTNRDAWVYGFDKDVIANNIKKTIGVYNSLVDGFAKERSVNPNLQVDDFAAQASTARQIKWDAPLKADLKKGIKLTFDKAKIQLSQYRPFQKQRLYFDRNLNNSLHRMHYFFPKPGTKNLAICISGIGVDNFSVSMVNIMPDLNLITAGQCFPFHYYDKSAEGSLYSDGKMVDNIPDTTLKSFRKKYGTEQITRKDIFYYVYGLLHSPDYKEAFKGNLSKMLPHIPYVSSFKDFQAFSHAGKTLGDLHVKYEDADEYPLVEREAQLALDQKNCYEVKKIAFAGNKKNPDKTCLVYNSFLYLSGIPLQAYEYTVNGKSPIEWIIDRYQMKTDKDSGIVNDPNQYSEDPKYIVSLIKKAVHVSMESSKIISGLPALKID